MLSRVFTVPCSVLCRTLCCEGINTLSNNKVEPELELEPSMQRCIAIFCLAMYRFKDTYSPVLLYIVRTIK